MMSKDLDEIRVTPNCGAKYMWGRKNWRFSTNILLYLMRKGEGAYSTPFEIQLSHFTQVCVYTLKVASININF